MTIPCSRNDLEIKKFRECPDDSGEVVVGVKICDAVPVNVQVNVAQTPTIYNLSAPTAGTEYSQSLNANTRQILLRVRGNGRAQISFTSGESGTKYITIPSGASLSLTDLGASVTLYIQTDKNAQVIEILEWT